MVYHDVCSGVFGVRVLERVRAERLVWIMSRQGEGDDIVD